MTAPPQMRIARSYHLMEGAALIPLQEMAQAATRPERVSGYASGDEYQLIKRFLFVPLSAYEDAARERIVERRDTN